MRTSSLGFVLLLAACGQDAPEAPAVDSDRLIECALAGAASFRRACSLDHVDGKDWPELIVRHPDGGFRRFEWVATRGGPDLMTADGAQPAEVSRGEAFWEARVGEDRYRFPIELLGRGLQ